MQNLTDDDIKRMKCCGNCRYFQEVILARTEVGTGIFRCQSPLSIQNGIVRGNGSCENWELTLRGKK